MNDFPTTVFLSLGSNVGDAANNLVNAIQLITEIEKTSQFGFSGIYKTKAWGKTDQDDFKNVCLSMMTYLKPENLMEKLLEIEEYLGRVRGEKWGPRIIDIDILLYGNKIIETSTLTVPHPEMHKRNFVLIPLMEIDPHFYHPVFHKSISELSRECKDQSAVILERDINKIF